MTSSSGGLTRSALNFSNANLRCSVLRDRASTSRVRRVLIEWNSPNARPRSSTPSLLFITSKQLCKSSVASWPYLSFEIDHESRSALAHLRSHLALDGARAAIERDDTCVSSARCASAAVPTSSYSQMRPALPAKRQLENEKGPTGGEVENMRGRSALLN